MLKEFFFPICKTSVLFDKPKLAMHLTSEYSTHHSAFAKIGNRDLNHIPQKIASGDTCLQTCSV
jgi:hypothetical protein